MAVADATPTNGETPLEVTFTGSNSTDDIAVTSYLWDFKDGSPTQSIADPIHIFTSGGTYNVDLTVEDVEGLTNSTTITIVASNPTNDVPVAIASASPLTGTTPLEVSFNGEGSTDDVGVVNYLWDFKDSTPTSNSVNPVHSFTVGGTYVVELTVEDAEGLTNTTTISIVVNSPNNQAPVAIATASPLIGTIPFEVTFNGSDSTDDVAIVSYLWDFKDSTPTSNSANPVHIFTVGGTYAVELTVEDAEGLTNTTTISVVVNDPNNQAPSAIITATPINGPAPLEVAFNGSNSTDDNAIVSYLWDFKDGDVTSNVANPVHTYTSSGTYNVELTVEDAEGLSDSNTLAIVVTESSTIEDIKGVLIVNPAKEVAQIQLIDNGLTNKIVNKVYLHDVTGRLIGTYSPKDIFAHGLYQVPIASLSDDSVYFIGFEMNDGGKIVLKLVVKN